jgi:hypothetical protein
MVFRHRERATYYPTLTADERFQLFVAALARDDDQELDRLEDTCPRYCRWRVFV